MLDFTKKNSRWIFLGTLLVATIFIWYAVFRESRGGILTVSFLDIGQGDAIFIDAPSGNQMLVDGGPGKSILSALGRRMPFYDRKIGAVLATHPDSDHIGGLPSVLENYKTDFFLYDGLETGTAADDALMNDARNFGLKEIVARRGMKIDLGGGAVVQILFPDRDMTGSDTNTASIVAKLIYGKTSFLLTGDSPAPVENYLAATDGKNLKSDVLKVAHHGSKNSASEVFLGYVSPSEAVISAGLNNRYGHPHKEVLDLLQKFSIPFGETFKSGDIVFQSDGEVVKRIR